MRRMKKYTPTKFKAKDSVYDKTKADYAVSFIECLCHTKGTWAGKPFTLIDWQEQIIRDIFGIIKPNGLTDHFGYGMPDDGQWDDEREVDYVTGCAMAIPRRAFERIGLFDDRYYPTYYEEVEFAIRLRKAGFRIVYNPKAVLRHLESKTEVRYSPRFFTRFHRSRMRLLLKNYSAAQLARAAWCEAKWIVFGLDWTWRKALFLPLLRAYIYSLLHLPWILHDRYYRFLPIGGPPTAETGKTSDAGPRRQAV